MALDGQLQPDQLESDLDEAEENIRVLVNAELGAQHALEPHEPPVGECPTCHRQGLTA